ncbi:MAG: hypothetical protein M0R46_06700 [Candidatus Muirbacterium halophilum]|nr:hypothetical protein [Candidatus Muirbacterium halophilum]
MIEYNDDLYYNRLNGEIEEEDEIEEIDINDIILDDDEDFIVSNTEEDIIIEEEEGVEEEEEEILVSKHKAEGKHALKYDSIFKGKKEESIDEDLYSCANDNCVKDTIELDKGSMYHSETIDNEQYIRSKRVKERIYEVLEKHTELNFLNNRRRPSKVDFNNYFSILKTHLINDSFTNAEIFTELAIYFSDNLFNMFKILDTKWRNIIIDELREHIGKSHDSKEIMNRNIYEGTELEFIWVDEFTNNTILVTGDVVEVDYPKSTYIVNSYEREYIVTLDMITQILNNTKFRFNISKLDKIDFL